MKLSDFKLAAFSQKLFAKAGLDLDKIHASGDDGALKAHIDAAVCAAKPNAEVEATLAEAVTENGRLSGELTNLNKELSDSAKIKADQSGFYSPLISALEDKGIKRESLCDDKGVFSPDKFNAEISGYVKKGAALELAKIGHPPINETPGAASAGAKVMPRASFTALSPKDQSAFCLSGGRVTE